MKLVSIIFGFLGFIGFCFMMCFGIFAEYDNAKICAYTAFFCMIVAMMLDPEPVTRLRK